MQLSENFGFLSAHDAELVKLGGLAERYFRDDPSTALVKLRQFAELLSKLIAARNALYIGERETFEDTLRRLSLERIVPREAADLFHSIRKFGNAAVHEARGSHAEALTALKFARQLGIWFHRTYGNKPDFKPGPFVPPPEPVDATAPLREKSPLCRTSLLPPEMLSPRRVARSKSMPVPAKVSNSVWRVKLKSGAIWERLAQETEAEKLEHRCQADGFAGCRRTRAEGGERLS